MQNRLADRRREPWQSPSAYLFNLSWGRREKQVAHSSLHITRSNPITVATESLPKEKPQKEEEGKRREKKSSSIHRVFDVDQPSVVFLLYISEYIDTRGDNFKLFLAMLHRILSLSLSFGCIRGYLFIQSIRHG